MIPFSRRMAVGKREKHKGNPRSLEPWKRNSGETLQTEFKSAQLHRTVTKSEKCCFHLSFYSFACLILLPKLLMCFMFLQSANSGILDPNSSQYCFQHELFLMTNTVKFSKCNSNSRQIQNEALMDSHDGPECTTQHVLCRNDRKLFHQMAALFKGMSCVHHNRAPHNWLHRRCALGFCLELGKWAPLRCIVLYWRHF